MPACTGNRAGTAGKSPWSVMQFPEHSRSTRNPFPAKNFINITCKRMPGQPCEKVGKEDGLFREGNEEIQLRDSLLDEKEVVNDA